MSDFKPASPIDLGSELFLLELLEKPFTPITVQSQTDFVVSGGITIKLRRGDPRATILNITKLPIAANIVINYPSESILTGNGDAAIQAILSQALTSLRETRVRPVREDRPDPELVDLIMKCMLYAVAANGGGEYRKVTVFAPSPVQRASATTSCKLGDAQRLAAVQRALGPLLDRIPHGGTLFEQMQGGSYAYSHFRAEHDMHFILVPDTITTTGPVLSADSVVERMKHYRILHDRVSCLGMPVVHVDAIMDVLSG